MTKGRFSTPSAPAPPGARPPPSKLAAVLAVRSATAAVLGAKRDINASKGPAVFRPQAKPVCARCRTVAIPGQKKKKKVQKAKAASRPASAPDLFSAQDLFSAPDPVASRLGIGSLLGSAPLSLRDHTLPSSRLRTAVEAAGNYSAVTVPSPSPYPSLLTTPPGIARLGSTSATLSTFPDEPPRINELGKHVTLRSPACFCSMATAETAHLLVGLLYSLSVHHPRVPVYLLVDAETKRRVEGWVLPPRLRITWAVRLREFSNSTEAALRRDGRWDALQMMRVDLLATALHDHPDAMFLDASTMVLSPLRVPSGADTGRNLGVTPNFVDPSAAKRAGHFSLGCVWVRRGSANEGLKLMAAWKRLSDPSSPSALRRIKKGAATKPTAHPSSDPLPPNHVAAFSLERLVASTPGSAAFTFSEEYDVNPRRNLEGISARIAAGRGGCLKYRTRVGVEVLRSVNLGHWSSGGDGRETALLVLLTTVMRSAGMARELLVAERLRAGRRGRWVVQIPRYPYGDSTWNRPHTGLRELAGLWANRFPNDVALSVSGASPYCWLGGGAAAEGGQVLSGVSSPSPSSSSGTDVSHQVLLYDWPNARRLRKVDCLATLSQESLGPIPSLSSAISAGSSPSPPPWISWPLHPALLESFLTAVPLPAYTSRPRRMFFAARITEENAEHRAALRDDMRWADVVEGEGNEGEGGEGEGGTGTGSEGGLFSLTAGEHRFPPKEYMMELSRSRFGLVARGEGRKTSREVELLALGVVPVLLPGVETERYPEPLREGVHFIAADTPEQLRERVAAADEEETWTRMSEAGREWYMRNVHSGASLGVTLGAIFGVPSV